jgi:hypothetical protein
MNKMKDVWRGGAPEKDAGLADKNLCMIPARVALAAQQPFFSCLTCLCEFHQSQWGVVRDRRNVRHYICPDCLAVRLVKITQPGWYIRSQIIWAKPNPMPESVTDRPTSSYELVYLLTKKARYFFDAVSVQEQYADDRMGASRAKSHPYLQAVGKNTDATTLHVGSGNSGRNIRNVWTAPESLARLRADLTHDERAYVVNELLRRGLF